MRTSFIVAANEREIIGKNDELPWHLPADLRRFKRLTMGHVVVVGRRTHDSIVARLGRSLPGRFTVVVSRQANASGDGVIFSSDAASALETAKSIEAFAGGDEVFVIGGAEVYVQLLDHVDRIYLTRVHQDDEGDAVMPANWLSPFTLVDKEPDQSDGQYSFLTYERR